VLDTSSAKEFALARWLVSGAYGGRLFVRCFDGAANIRENVASDVLASGSTMQSNSFAKGWNAGAVMADASLNRRQTIRVGDGVAFAQVGIVGFDGQIEVEAPRLFGLPEAATAVVTGTPTVPVGIREFVAKMTWDLPSLASGANSLIDVTAGGARQGDLAAAAIVSSTRFIVLDAAASTTGTVRVEARNISQSAAFDPGAVKVSVSATMRRTP